MSTISCLGLLVLLIFLLPYVLFRGLIAYFQQKHPLFRNKNTHKTAESETQKQQPKHSPKHSASHKTKIFEKDNSEYVDFEDIQ